ncbi:unnamed protein product [Paramecium sonneborni]|uniref:Uncharacterized protein n=1 Tax=Paramecium sonneborni TaxID=65129 RepID=A0A8S1RKE5_9CILI|nr:unnamed protein product [Paramecium sonneborni]
MVYSPGPGDYSILKLLILAFVNEIPLLLRVDPNSYVPGPGLLCNIERGLDFIQSINSLFTLQSLSAYYFIDLKSPILQFPGPGVQIQQPNICRQLFGNVGPIIFIYKFDSPQLKFSQFN